MLIGYNTNIKYKGKTYHVQTEDSGPTNPQIITLLYHQGAILSSKKTNYAYLLGQSDFENKLRELMKQQHREMIMELKKIAVVESYGTEDPPEKDDDDSEVTLLGNSPTEDFGNRGSVGISKGIGEIKETEPSKGSSQSREGTKKGLDDILIDYITRRGK